MTVQLIKQLTQKKKYICTHDIERYTFLNYNENSLYDSKYISKRRSSSSDEINNSLSNSWLVVPRSISYKDANPFVWLHQIPKIPLKSISHRSAKIFDSIGCNKLKIYACCKETIGYNYVFLIDIFPFLYFNPECFL